MLPRGGTLFIGFSVQFRFTFVCVRCAGTPGVVPAGGPTDTTPFLRVSGPSGAPSVSGTPTAHSLTSLEDGRRDSKSMSQDTDTQEKDDTEPGLVFFLVGTIQCGPTFLVTFVSSPLIAVPGIFWARRDSFVQKVRGDVSSQFYSVMEPF